MPTATSAKPQRKQQQAKTGIAGAGGKLQAAQHDKQESVSRENSVCDPLPAADAAPLDMSGRVKEMIEKKIRNLDKRRVSFFVERHTKLLEYKKLEKKGKELNKEQKDAMSKLGEVDMQLEFASDVAKNINELAADNEKVLKAQEKHEKGKQHEKEVGQLRSFVCMQEVLSVMLKEELRPLLLAGQSELPKLSKNELSMVQCLYELVCPTLEDCTELDQWTKALDQSARAAYLLLAHANTNKQLPGEKALNCKDMHRILKDVKESALLNVLLSQKAPKESKGSKKGSPPRGQRDRDSNSPSNKSDVPSTISSDVIDEPRDQAESPAVVFANGRDQDHHTENKLGRHELVSAMHSNSTATAVGHADKTGAAVLVNFLQEDLSRVSPASDAAMHDNAAQVAGLITAGGYQQQQQAHPAVYHHVVPIPQARNPPPPIPLPGQEASAGGDPANLCLYIMLRNALGDDRLMSVGSASMHSGSNVHSTNSAMVMDQCLGMTQQSPNGHAHQNNDDAAKPQEHKSSHTTVIPQQQVEGDHGGKQAQVNGHANANARGQQHNDSEGQGQGYRRGRAQGYQQANGQFANQQQGQHQQRGAGFNWRGGRGNGNNYANGNGNYYQGQAGRAQGQFHRGGRGGNGGGGGGGYHRGGQGQHQENNRRPNEQPVQQEQQ